MLTFYDLQQSVLRYIDEGDDAVAGTTRALVKDALNRSHRQVLTERSWPFMLWPGERSFATVSGTRAYALPHGTGKLLTVWDDALNEPTPMISRREWEGLGVNRTDPEGAPLGMIYGDTWPVAVQPSSVGELITCATTSDADALAACGIVLTGLNASGVLVNETLALADIGATSSVTSTVAFAHILTVTKTGTYTTTLTLTAPTAGTLLTLTASEYGKQYPTLEFIETPNAARTYLYTAMRTPRVLSNNFDIPDTPYPFSEIHVYDALLDLTAYNTELGAKEQRLWADRREKIWNDLVTAVDEGIAGSRPRFVRNMNERAIGRVRLN